MTGPCNIATAFARIARESPGLEAIIAEDVTLTYAKLWRVVERFAARMQALGIGRGSVVGIDTTDMIVSVASILALSIRGAAYIVIDGDFGVAGRQDVQASVRAAFESCVRTFGAEVSPATILVVDHLALTQDGVPRRRIVQQQFAERLEGNDPMILDRAVFKFQAVSHAE